MRRIAIIGLVSVMTTAALAAGCERGKEADKQAVEEIVAQRLDAEKTKATLEKNAELVKENLELKAKVADLEQKLAAIQTSQAKVAQNAAARRPVVKTEEHQKQVKTLHEALTGGSAK